MCLVFDTIETGGFSIDVHCCMTGFYDCFATVLRLIWVYFVMSSGRGISLYWCVLGEFSIETFSFSIEKSSLSIEGPSVSIEGSSFTIE